MIVLRPPGFYSYLDPGLVHTEYGFASVAYMVADDATIQAGLVFQEDGLADLATRALEIFLRAGVEYSGVNVALAVYQAISERLPQETFTWMIAGLEDVMALWPSPTPIERARASPEQREPAPEKPLRMPEELDSPELVPILPPRVRPVPVPPEEAVLPPEEEIPPPEELIPTVVIPEIARPPVAPPEEPRRFPPRVVPRVGVPVEREIPPVEAPPVEPPPTVSEVAEEIAEKIGELTGFDYGEIQKIVERGVDRLSERFQDPGVAGQVTTVDEVEVEPTWVKAQWKRDFHLAREASEEIMKGVEREERDWKYPVSLPGQE